LPELPETETIARDLDVEVRGRRIVGITVRRPDVLRATDAEGLRRRLTGATIERVWRRAKLVVLDLSTSERLVVQPRFTGALLLDAGDLPETERRFSTLDLELDDARRLHYRDIRRLGTVAIMDSGHWASYSGGLGIEPLDDSFSADALSGIIRRSRQAIKKVVMDQRHVVGIGNIYANEALWRAGILPSREARSLREPEVARLHQGIVSVLTESIAARGTSFRDYRDALGRRGSFVERLAVYGRAGETCPRCERALSGTHEIDGRATVFCARCQR
jgi:formamidopyrimidine-DNA glycosylase